MSVPVEVQGIVPAEVDGTSAERQTVPAEVVGTTVERQAGV